MAPFLSNGVVFVAGNGNDIISGTPFSDRLLAGAGDDTVFFQLSDEDFLGGEGYDLGIFDSDPEGDNSHDSLVATVEDYEFELLLGGGGDDELSTLEGSILGGGAGMDRLIVANSTGFQNASILWGGEGADTFVLPAGSSILVVEIADLDESNFHLLRPEMFADVPLADTEKVRIIVNPDPQDKIALTYQASLFPDFLSADQEMVLDVTGFPIGTFTRPVSFDDDNPFDVPANSVWTTTNDGILVQGTGPLSDFNDPQPVVFGDFDFGDPKSYPIGAGFAVAGATIQGSTIGVNGDAKTGIIMSSDGDDIIEPDRDVDPEPWNVDPDQLSNTFYGSKGNDVILGGIET